MSRFSSLDELKKKEEEEGRTSGGPGGGQPEGQNYYAGGNDQRGGGSGLNVVDPNFDRLKANASSEGKLSANAKKLTMYKNGIMIGDGPFRARDDPRTIEIMNELTAGSVPVELRGSDEPVGDVEVALVDKSGETYSPPFGSAGWNGGAVGSMIGKAPASEEMEGIFDLEDIDDNEVVVDSTPSTLIQLKLASGKKVKLKLNHFHKVRDILRLIKKDGEVTGLFTLSAGFPPVTLRDLEATISDAKLMGSSITQSNV